MHDVKETYRYRLIPVVLALLLLVGLFSLLAPMNAYAAGESITISGSGLNDPTPITITQDMLRGTEPLPEDLQTVAGAVYLPQTVEWYSTINTWPTKSWYRGQGVKLTDLLDLAGGLNENATQIRFTSSDGFKTTFTVQELIQEPRYRYPNFMDTGLPGHLIGDASKAEPVEAIIAHKSCTANVLADVMKDHYLNSNDANLLLYGQRAVTEQTNSRFAKYVTLIEVLTDPAPQWDKPTAQPVPGKVKLGTKVKLYSTYNDEDKVYYTTDGSSPTFNSSMYNWVASRWWKDRKDELDKINQPIEINGNTTIKAIVIGPGKLDSEVVTFQYQIDNETELKSPPLLTKDNTDNAVGQKIELTFLDDAAWREAITDIKVNGVSISGKYNIAAGLITIEAETFSSAGDYTIVVNASGYLDAQVIQNLTDHIVIPPEGEVILTIKGSGVTTPKEFTLAQLKEMNQYQEVYSSINTWPTKSWYVGKGVRLRDLLNEAGLTGNAEQIRFKSRDGYYTTLTVQELLVDKRYCFPNFESGGMEGHIPGSSSGARTVEPLLALVSASGTDDADYMNDNESLLLMLGQRAVTEQTGPLFAKYVNEIEVLTSSPGKWDEPTAKPGPGEVPAGTKVELHSPYDDQDKVYYTTDGSNPTLNSPIFNWVAKRWWSSRGEATVNAINKPIEILQDTTIKAITIGPGKANSNIVEFTYKVTGPPLQVSDQINPSQGGQVSLGDQVVLDIPAGALEGTDPVEIKIERVSEPPAAPTGFRIIGHTYEFKVGDLINYQFRKPVTIKLKFNPAEVGSEQKPAVFYYDEKQQQWINLGGQVSDDTITVQIDHFTKFAVMVVDTEIVTVTIKPAEGGEVTLGEAASLKIPSGALAGTEPVEVKIERISEPPAAAVGLKSLAAVYEFSVDGKTNYSFNQPVTIALKFNSDDLDTEQTPAIYYYDLFVEKWVRIGGEVSDNTITIEVDHLGQFTVMTETKAAEVDLKDISGHWAEDNIKQLVTRGAVSGYPDGTFKPDNNITRAEFAIILLKAFDVSPYSGKVFTDTKEHWAREAISTAAHYGIVSGYDANTFQPDEYINREQMAVMIVKAAKLNPVESELNLTDSSSISGWAKDAVAAAVENEIIKGYPDKTIRPRGKATRAEAVTVVINALNKQQ
ncbi:MAG: S-layer homology domain-containing protein [Syntrophomonadaceae bacterium]|jgi:hypothetical protein